MMYRRLSLFLCLLAVFSKSHTQIYPQNYFRNPLNIKMELVANFGELRNNHWHMGLDIRTQQRENLPVYAAAEGYIAMVKIEPVGFGRAIYINHPNGLTTVYAHLNNFTPSLERWVKDQQYILESWAVELNVPSHLFPLEKGQFFAYSGNTGGSAGPHVHFEIRDTQTDKCLNPLLFGFPIPDAVPPSLTRIAMYDRNKTVYGQSPQIIPLKKTGTVYGLAIPNTIKVGSNKISFAIGAVDRFTGSSNPNGIYSGRILMDGELQSGFTLNNIGYDETRYMNAHIDYRYKTAGGGWLQHLSRMPGDLTEVYQPTENDGVLYLDDESMHQVRIEIRDAAQNLSVVLFNVQYDPALPLPIPAANLEKWIPGHVNVFESEYFEAYSTENTVYDTLNISYRLVDEISTSTIGPVHHFLNTSLPSHDSITVRLRANRSLSDAEKDKVVIINTSGTKKVVEKACWQEDWAWAKFRQFGIYQAIIDTQPPVINAPAKGTRIVFTPRDNLNSIKSFRAELDGAWLRFTNNGGRSWVYNFDEKISSGKHELKVIVEDEAGNITTRLWNVFR